MEKHIEKWVQMACDNVKRYRLKEEPEVLYIIKTGFANTYIVVREDGYHLHLGKTTIMTKAKIQRVFKIDVDI